MLLFQSLWTLFYAVNQKDPINPYLKYSFVARSLSQCWHFKRLSDSLEHKKVLGTIFCKFKLVYLYAFRSFKRKQLSFLSEVFLSELLPI